MSHWISSLPSSIPSSLAASKAASGRGCGALSCGELSASAGNPIRSPPSIPRAAERRRAPPPAVFQARAGPRDGAPHSPYPLATPRQPASYNRAPYAPAANRFPEVPGGYPFPRLEQEVLAHWAKHEVFRQTVERTPKEGEFVFYDGPPTANNVPHVGHVITRVIKDLFPRYRTMRGWRVRRKAGWDTHGLPVEIEVEKRLGFTGKRQIEEYGIAAFNRACLESVHTYERQWRAMSERVGHWLDYDHAYWTYSNRYIESVWWALAELAKKGLLDRGYKIQPYCARCGTTLSSHEVAQNYKEAEDPSVWTLFRAPRRPDHAHRRAAANGRIRTRT